MYKFADDLQRWRLALGLSQAELAEAVGVTQQTVSDWEQGKLRPGIKRVDVVARALQITEDELLAALARDALAKGAQGRRVIEDKRADTPRRRGKRRPLPAALTGKLSELTADELAKLDAYIDGLLQGRI